MASVIDINIYIVLHPAGKKTYKTKNPQLLKWLNSKWHWWALSQVLKADLACLATRICGHFWCLRTKWAHCGILGRDAVLTWCEGVLSYRAVSKPVSKMRQDAVPRVREILQPCSLDESRVGYLGVPGISSWNIFWVIKWTNNSLLWISCYMRKRNNLWNHSGSLLP